MARHIALDDSKLDSEKFVEQTSNDSDFEIVRSSRGFVRVDMQKVKESMKRAVEIRRIIRVQNNSTDLGF